MKSINPFVFIRQENNTINNSNLQYWFSLDSVDYPLLSIFCCLRLYWRLQALTIILFLTLS